MSWLHGSPVRVPCGYYDIFYPCASERQGCTRNGENHSDYAPFSPRWGHSLWDILSAHTPLIRIKEA